MKNKFTKAKKKWYKNSLISAVIYYDFGCLTPYVVCQLTTTIYGIRYWKFNDFLETSPHWKHRLIHSFFKQLDNKFFNARKLALTNKNITVMYESKKTIERNYIKMLKLEGLL